MNSESQKAVEKKSKIRKFSSQFGRSGNPVRETVRMYPIAPLIINRQSTEEFHMKNIGTIPAGTRIAIDMYTLHFDPDLWGPVDLHIFYHERFETKHYSMTWIPFEAGPRNCVGMRFALMEFKMALVRLLKTYSLVNCSDKTNKCFEQLETGFCNYTKRSYYSFTT
jgi:cytochrome P450